MPSGRCLEGPRYDAVPPICRRSFLSVPCGFTPYGFFFKKCQYGFLKANPLRFFESKPKLTLNLQLNLPNSITLSITPIIIDSPKLIPLASTDALSILIPQVTIRITKEIAVGISDVPVGLLYALHTKFLKGFDAEIVLRIFEAFGKDLINYSRITPLLRHSISNTLVSLTAFFPTIFTRSKLVLSTWGLISPTWFTVDHNRLYVLRRILLQ